MNGWQPSRKPFGIDAIGRGGSGNVSATYPLFDHALFFRSGRTNSAICGQPYVFDAPAWDRIAAKYRLEVSTPSRPEASFHLPGHCYFVMLHERTHAVQWLPEHSSDDAGGLQSQDRNGEVAAPHGATNPNASF